VSFHPQMPYQTPGFQRSERPLPAEGEPFVYTPERRAQFEANAAHYPPEFRQAAILYALYLVQEQIGYVSRRGMAHVAEVIGCSPMEVEDVTSYYAMFYRQPVGKYVLQVCRTLSCALCGAERLTEELSNKLGIKPGETDPSGTFTLLEVECLGACDRAPVLMVNHDGWHECLKPEEAARLVDEVKARGIAALSGCVHKTETP
jgi:NADH-quinone oxidoreductase E subunit